MFSAWKAAYLASKLPLASSADALTREITLESSCRHIHTSFLLEIQGCLTLEIQGCLTQSFIGCWKS